jgi:DNA helicase-2/ATP-dependent DNA helicase PcrA
MSLFTERLNRLNRQQREAVQTVGRCVVLAGPGSGKTHVLVLKVAHLIGEVIQPPRKVACITFLNDAVQEIKDRLWDFGYAHGAHVFVGTVHSFCLANIILPFKSILLDRWPTRIVIADKDQQIDCLAFAASHSGSVWDRYETIQQLEELRKYRVHVSLNTVPKAWVENGQAARLHQLKADYETELHRRGMIDFNDIVIGAYQLIQTSREVRSFVVSCFPWIAIDEYQDLQPLMHGMVRD